MTGGHDFRAAILSRSQHEPRTEAAPPRSSASSCGRCPLGIRDQS
jgi:hypothetical protein